MLNITPEVKKVNPIATKSSRFHASTWPPHLKKHEITTVDEVVALDSLAAAAKLIRKKTWSPIVFEPSYRKSDNFKTASLCVLDVDDGLSLAHALVKFAGYKHVIATTKSHQNPESDKALGDRYRVVLWFDEEITSRAKYEKVMMYHLNNWDFSDPQCKDAARFYWRCVKVISTSEEGMLVSTDVQLPARRPATFKPRKQNGAIDINALVAEKAGRNNALTSYAGRIWGGDIDTYDKLHEALLLVNEQITTLAGPLPEQEVHAIVKSISARKPNWKAGLRKTEKGTIKTMAENLDKILSEHPSWENVIKFDDWNNLLTLIEPPYNRPWGPGAIQDVDATSIQLWLSRELNYQTGRETIDAAVDVIGKLNPYDPLKDLLDSKDWDSVDRLKDVAIMFGAENTDYNNMIIRKWMLAAVTRVYTPGYKFDNVLLLAGRQGIGKSSLLQTLVLDPTHYLELVTNIGGKDTTIAMQGKWIVDFSELNCLNRKENTAIKTFLTALTDEYRPVYGKHNITRPRRCVFAGTTNDQEILRDSTGSRRFWVLTIKKDVDIELIKKNRVQLWAQVVHMFKNKLEKTWLGPAEEKLRQTVNEDYQEIDAWESTVHAYMNRKKSSTTSNMLEAVIGKEMKDISKSDKNRVSNILRRLGCERKQVSQHGIREYVWFLPTDSDEEV